MTATYPVKTMAVGTLTNSNHETLRGWMLRRGCNHTHIARREAMARRSREFFCTSCNAMTVNGMCRVDDTDTQQSAA